MTASPYLYTTACGLLKQPDKHKSAKNFGQSLRASRPCIGPASFINDAPKPFVWQVNVVHAFEFNEDAHLELLFQIAL
jgi:hypothetical protein